MSFPLTLILLWPLLGFPPLATLFGAIACYVVPTMFDVAGALRARFMAYAVTLAVELLAIAVAATLTWNVWAAVIGTVVVGMAAIYAGLLGGYVPSAIPMVLLPWFLAISVPDSLDRLGLNLVGWTVGFVIAVAFALVFWPVRLQQHVRVRAAVALRAIADVVLCRWVGDRTQLPQLDETARAASVKVNESMRIALRRPGGATTHERDLWQLIGVIDQLTLQAAAGADEDESVSEVRRELAETISQTLRDCATCVETPRRRDRSVRPNTRALSDARERNVRSTIDDIREELGPDNAAVVTAQIAHRETLRATSTLAMLAAAHTLGTVGEDSQFVGVATFAGKQTHITLPARTPMWVLRSNATRDSIWLRNSIRSGVGFGLAVLLMYLTGLAHGFWIALGVFVAMRFDAGGSRRTAEQLLIGTVVGFGLGAGLLALAQGSTPLMWALLAATAGLATYTPGVAGLTLGQVTFTVFLIFLFGVVAPSGFATAEVRVVDVLLAIGVTLVVSTLFWPGGVAEVVRSSLRDATTASADYLVAAFARLAKGPDADRELDEAASESVSQFLRATHNFDLSLMNTVPGAVPAEQWVPAANAIAQVMLGAEKTAFFARNFGTTEVFPDATAELFQQGRIVASAFVERTCRSCGIKTWVVAADPLPDCGLQIVADSLARTVGKRGGKLTEGEAAAALALINSAHNLVQIQGPPLEPRGAASRLD